MEAFTFAVSTQVDFPIHIRVYVGLSDPRDKKRCLCASSQRKVWRPFLLIGTQGFVGRKAKADPIFRSLETTGVATYWLSPESQFRSVRYGTAMVRLEAIGGAIADLVQII